jgi:predicted DNA-binding protein
VFGTKPVRITVTVTERQRDGLRRISEKTGVSVSQYVREALERVLDLAERQMRSIERALEKDES